MKAGLCEGRRKRVEEVGNSVELGTWIEQIQVKAAFSTRHYGEKRYDDLLRPLFLGN